MERAPMNRNPSGNPRQIANELAPSDVTGGVMALVLPGRRR
jgi:hypothetical protein